MACMLRQMTARDVQAFKWIQAYKVSSKVEGKAVLVHFCLFFEFSLRLLHLYF